MFARSCKRGIKHETQPESSIVCVSICICAHARAGVRLTLSLYPCLRVLVPDVQCSFYPACRSSRVENENSVSDYQTKYGLPGSQYSCWYNPGRPSQVVQHRRFHLRHVVNGVTGSAAVLVASIVLLVCVVRHRRFFKAE